jgi:hypothetical protein
MSEQSQLLRRSLLVRRGGRVWVSWVPLVGGQVFGLSFDGNIITIRYLIVKYLVLPP